MTTADIVKEIQKRCQMHSVQPVAEVDLDYHVAQRKAVLTRCDRSGVWVGVASNRPDTYHWSLVPIDDASRPEFTKYMASLVGTQAT